MKTKWKVIIAVILAVVISVGSISAYKYITSPKEESIPLETTLEDAAERGFRAAENGDILALSPACASMDMFKDYKERGERFKAVIRQKIGKNA